MSDAAEKKPRSDLLVTYRDPKELLPYARNARTHPKQQVDEIRASIREFGFTNPVLLKDDERTIGAGHARTLAAVQEGLQRIPTITLPGLTETQWRAYVIADNKLALNAGWDLSLLKLELDDLKLSDFDMQLTGFSLDEIGDILNPPDPKYSPKLDAPIYTPKGDMPSPAELCDQTKAKELEKEIEIAKLAPDISAFLRMAAGRHVVFDYHRIADYYAGSPAHVQRLMERSGLVIIDIDSAIENGFVILSDKLRELATSMGEPRRPGRSSSGPKT